MAQNDSASLTPDQASTLAGVLDAIIPESDDGRLPGAGALGLASYIEEALRKAPELRPFVEQGLAVANELAAQRGAASFASTSPSERGEVLNELAAREPGFLPALTFHTYTGYYLNPRVQEALGLEARPPHPKGYEMEPSDLGLLDAVRKRDKLYREC